MSGVEEELGREDRFLGKPPECRGLWVWERCTLFGPGTDRASKAPVETSNLTMDS